MMTNDPLTEADGDRRRFFREALGRLLRPFTEESTERFPSAGPKRRLRPPGAMDEARFVDACQRCGHCVEVCPALAIRPVISTDRVVNGTPFIDPDAAACVVCEGLKCTHVCPSGALLPLSAAADIAMGLAEVDEAVCVRNIGESCSICVDRCPLGATAIRIDGPRSPTVVSPGCVGCGVCQFYCPTTPKAIVVHPRAARS